MEQVFTFLDAIDRLEDGLRSYLRASLRRTTPDKDTILVQEGSIAGTIGFIEKGLIRGLRTRRNDSEFTSWIMKEGDVYCSVRSFFTQQPATESVQTLEPCIIYTLTFDQYKYTYTRWRSFQLHRAELFQKYYLLSEEREDMHQQEDTYDRFCYLVKHYPDLINRVQDQFLASFINTTPQYFSTLKKQYVKRHGHF